MLALSPDGRTAYTSNVGAGTVSVIDVAAAEGHGGGDRGEARPAHRALHRRPLRLHRRPGRAAPGGDRHEDEQARPRRGPPGGRLRHGAHPGRQLARWSRCPAPSQVAVLDLSSMEVVRTLDVPKAPQEVLVRPDGRVAYVSCDAAGQVAEIDLAGWKVTRLIPAGPMADGLAWAKQP